MALLLEISCFTCSNIITTLFILKKENVKLLFLYGTNHTMAPTIAI